MADTQSILPIPSKAKHFVRFLPSKASIFCINWEFVLPCLDPMEPQEGRCVLRFARLKAIKYWAV